MFAPCVSSGRRLAPRVTCKPCIAASQSRWACLLCFRASSCLSVRVLPNLSLFLASSSRPFEPLFRNGSRSVPDLPNSFMASAVFFAPSGIEANRSASFGISFDIGRTLPLASVKPTPRSLVIAAAFLPPSAALVRFFARICMPLVPFSASTPVCLKLNASREASSVVKPVTRLSFETSPATFLNVAIESAPNLMAIAAPAATAAAPIAAMPMPTLPTMPFSPPASVAASLNAPLTPFRPCPDLTAAFRFAPNPLRPDPAWAVSFISLLRPLNPDCALETSPTTRNLITLVISATVRLPHLIAVVAGVLKLPPRQIGHLRRGNMHQRADGDRVALQQRLDRLERGGRHSISQGRALLAVDEPA